MSSIRINFDTANNPEQPTLILAYRDGRKIGEIVAQNVIVKDSMNLAEISFKVNKFLDNKKNTLWDKIVDFKLLWCKEFDLWFEIYVTIDETNETIKNVSCKQLGQAELSQIKIFTTEINTENDIARDDYIRPTILYDAEHKDSSLLHRIMEKAPHYSIIRVDETIASIQRTFTFDNISIYDAFQQIAEEIGCLFVFHSNSDSTGKIQRTISVYDLKSNCNACGHRGEFTIICPECKSSDINEGYGEDTTIFITSDELADNLQFESDTDSIKNCFKLEAGDDLMTATIRNCNPNGTEYIWHISNDVKEDMSKELVEKLESYDNIFNTYQNDYIADVNPLILKQYNNLVEKYQKYNENLQLITSPIQGYPALMTAYYNTIDLLLFLKSELMPSVKTSDTNATEQAALLTTENLSPIAVTDVGNISLATANSVVLSMAKIVVGAGYRVKIDSSSLESQIWTGSFIITNYSDEEDTANSETISIEINDDYEYFVQQKLEKLLKDKNTDLLNITGLFKLEHKPEIDHDEEIEKCPFCNELTKYGLNSLSSFYDSCRACIDILVEQGITDFETWANSDPNLYNDLYMPYYQKLKVIEKELKIRQEEIDFITGVYDEDGTLIQNGLQTLINDVKEEIQKQLDFQNYIGNELWLEFCAYRRDDKYSNTNYISDGLSNSELFEKALEFINIANDEIYKSAELQHSITSTLKNLLVIKKFRLLTKYFKTGNWIRVLIDDKIYKLRLLDYEINFDNINSLSVSFSDVLKTASGEVDQQSIMSKIVSITSSYSYVQRQASQGSESNKVIQQWNENGIDATNTKIISGADNQTQIWDSHGMLFREYDSITDTYNDKQLKIINSTIAITDDNWETTKTAIGNFYYRDPKTNELKSDYGVNGEVVIGKLMIGKGLGIYNENGSLTFDENGFSVTNKDIDNDHKDKYITVSINPNDNSIFSIKNETGNVLSFGDDGTLIVVGNIVAKNLQLMDDTTIDSSHITGFSDVALSGDYNDLINTPILSGVALSGDYNDLINMPIIQSAILSDGTQPVNGQAVYNYVNNYAVNKSQGSENANKFVVTDSNGNIALLTLNQMKTKLGIV